MYAIINRGQIHLSPFSTTAEVRFSAKVVSQSGQDWGVCSGILKMAMFSCCHESCWIICWIICWIMTFDTGWKWWHGGLVFVLPRWPLFVWPRCVFPSFSLPAPDMGKVGQKVVVQRQTAVIQAAQLFWSQDLLETALGQVNVFSPVFKLPSKHWH